MAIRCASHCVYDTRDHLVWAPKYGKWVLQGAERERVRELLLERAAHHGVEIAEWEVDKDQVHVFLSVPPTYSIGQVVGRLKAVSAREIRAGFPEVRTQLWGGEFWEDGYFARTVGEKVTADVSKKYIRFHEATKRQAEPLQMYEKAPPGRAGFFTPRAVRMASKFFCAARRSRSSASGSRAYWSRRCLATCAGSFPSARSMMVWYAGAAEDYITVSLRGEHCFALRVRGESMLPEFREGDMIVVDPDLSPRSGDFVVAVLDGTGEATFKRYQKKKDGEVLMPLNPDYMPIVLQPEHRLVGKVIRLVRSY